MKNNNSNSTERQTKDFYRATSPMSRFDISSTHYTTAPFLGNRVVFARELAPKQTISINLKSFIRTQPTLQPAFLHIDGRFSAFFIPFELIWTKFNEFIAQSLRNGSVPQRVPTCSEVTLANALETFLADGGKNTGSATDHDIYFFKSWGTNSSAAPTNPVYYKFNTPASRNVMATLHTLGYKIQGGICVAGSSPLQNNQYLGTTFSALPLLCWSKCWLDYFRVDNPELSPFEPDTISSMSASNLSALFQRMAYYPIAFAKDYFCHDETVTAGGNTNFQSSSSTKSPALSSVIDALETEYATEGPDGLNPSGAHSGNTPTTYRGATPYIYLDGEDTTQLSALALNHLARLTDYVKRISVSGLTSFKRILNEYGISTTDTPVTKTAEFIGECVFTLNAQEVTQTSDGGDSTSLGEQTNASIKGSTNWMLKYQSDKFGMLLIYLNIRPKVEFLEGRPRWIQHTRPYDFFHPDFDNWGYQATRIDELFVGQSQSRAGASGATSSIWVNQGGRTNYANGAGTIGVLPTYAEYKSQQSLATGDFARNSMHNSFDTMHLGRLYDSSYSGLPNSYELMQLTSNYSGAADYMRIFVDTNTDPFVCHLDFNAVIDAPMKPLFDLPGDWECAKTGGQRSSSNPNKFAHI